MPMTMSRPGPMRALRFGLALTALVLTSTLTATGTRAADLPPHGPLRVRIVSDEVNPHGLSNPELTQPGDLSAALNMPGSGSP